jgi:hypothetical protein
MRGFARELRRRALVRLGGGPPARLRERLLVKLGEGPLVRPGGGPPARLREGLLVKLGEGPLMRPREGQYVLVGSRLSATRGDRAPRTLGGDVHGSRPASQSSVTWV